MARTKKRVDPEFWLTGPSCGKNAKGAFLPFVRLYPDLLQAPNFCRLSYGARWCYICMTMEAKGKPDFTFPRSVAAKYGLPESTLFRVISELEKAEFIRCTSPGKPTRTANEYRFVWGWKIKANSS